jgi:hypothetical protein
VVRYRSSCNTKLLALYFFKIVPQMARRPDREKEEILSEKDLKELRCNLAHLSLSALQEFYQRAFRIAGGLQPSSESSEDANASPGLEAVAEVALRACLPSSKKISDPLWGRLNLLPV